MKTLTLLALLLVTQAAFSQSKLKFQQISYQQIGGTTTLNINDKINIRDYQFNRFPVSWAENANDNYFVVNSNNITGGRVALSFLWETKPESKFRRYLDFGLNFSSINSFHNHRDAEQVLTSHEEQTSLGTLRYDSTLFRRQSISHSALVVGVDAQLRYMTKKDNWLKGYGGLKVFAGTTIKATTSVFENSWTATEYYLNDERISGLPHNYDVFVGEFQDYDDPMYFIGRLSAPIGVEARLWKPKGKLGSLSLFVEMEPGFEYTTGNYSGLRPMIGGSAGVRFNF